MNSSTKRVFICDLGHITAGGFTSEFIPYPIGCIKSYFRTHAKSRDQYEVSLFRDPRVLIREYLDNKPEVVAFSNYSWNRNLSIGIATEIKRRDPSTLIIFGGPNYPLEDPVRERWFRTFPAVDVYANGEGERPFQQLVDAWAETGSIEEVKRAGVDGCHALVDGKLFRTNDVTPRLAALDEFPSPYVKGYLDEFLIEHKLIPLMETNRGCPFACTFCEKGVTAWNKITFGPVERFREELRYVAERTSASFLLLGDNNFGMFKEDIEFAQVMRDSYETYGFPTMISAGGTAKARYDRVLESVKVLKGALPISVSVQSMDDAVLKNIKRKNLPFEKLLEIAADRYSDDSATRTKGEMILCLPGDTREKHVAGLCRLVDAGVSFMLVYTLILLDGSELSTEESRSKWSMKTMFRLNHRSFGSYEFGDTKVRAHEVEEVVVALDSMPFEDYLECRSFYFTLGVFYLDEIVFELLEFLKNFGIKTSDFIRYVHKEGRARFSPGLEKLYASYEAATRQELWASKQDLDTYMSTADRTTDEIRGIGGYNVIFWHRAVALTTLVDDIMEVAFDCARSLLGEEAERWSAYLDQLERCMVLRKRNVFAGGFGHDEEEFDFDFVGLEKKSFVGLPDRHATRVRISFGRTEDQARLFQTFPDGTPGAARALAKLVMSKMYRNMQIAESSGAGTEPVEAGAR